MAWYWAAVVSALALAAQSMGLQELQKRLRIPVYMAAVWLLACIPLGIANRSSIVEATSQSAVYLLIGGLASWAGMFTYNLAIRTQGNLGYVEVISGLRVAIVYVYSLVFLSSIVDALHLAAVVAAMVAAAVISFSKSASGVDTKLHGRWTGWAFWALISAASFAALMIVLRKAVQQGTPADVATFWILFVAGLLFVLQSSVSHGTMADSTQSRPSRRLLLALGTSLVVVITALMAAIGNTALFRSTADAPNLGFPAAISSGRVAILYFVAVMRGDSRLRWAHLGAVVLMILAIGALGL